MAEDEGFKVKDRRRFDESGNRKDADGEVDAASSMTRSAAKEEVEISAPDSNTSSSRQGAEESEGDSMAKPDGSDEQFIMKDSPTESGEHPPLDYSSFILSLATQAMVQLGEMEPPPGVDIPKNRQAAKHSIDVLEMLSLKTRGNLSEAEQRLTEEILHSLRRSFVRSKDS